MTNVVTIGLNITFRDVNAFVHDGKKQIIYNVSGDVNSSEMLALMGPSGSGKTSMLSILGQRTTSKVSGEILYGGRTMTPDLKREIGYVSQDDILFSELTVFESFYFVAMLRLSKYMTKDDKLKRVHNTIETLGLMNCKDTIIGNNLMRGVSGGERKRVSIGIELLIDPVILFMDEPTSGLDSTTAFKLMLTMKSLINESQRTIVASIHQPSSRMFQNIDKLLLFSEGHVLYNGFANNLIPWLGMAGFDIPIGVSVSDYILDIACAKDDRDKLLAYNHSQPQPQPQPQHQLQISNTRHIQDNIKVGASWFLQIQVLSTRCLKTKRFAVLSIQKIVEVIIIALLSGLFWFQIGNGNLTNLKVVDISGLLFFQVLFLSFSSLIQAILTFPPDFQILCKERQSNMYAMSSYYIARTISELPMDSLIPSLFCWVVYWMCGLRMDVNAFFQNWFSVLLIMFVAQSLGLLIGASIQNIKTALSFTTVLMLTIMLVGGFYVRSIPVWISWLKYLSFIYYGYGLVLKIEFNNRFVDCGGNKCLISKTDLLDLNVDEPVTLQVCMLLAFLILMRVGIYYILKLRTASLAKLTLARALDILLN